MGDSQVGRCGIRAVFFDRDGVINEDSGYVFRREDFVFYDDFFDAAGFFKSLGFKLIVITNQSGIDRGFYSVQSFLDISRFMQDEIFCRLNFYLDRIYFCRSLSPSHPCRKPNPGMILQAVEDFDLDLASSYLVGDKTSDVYAGMNAGIGNLFLLDRQNLIKCEADNVASIQSLSELRGYYESGF